MAVRWTALSIVVMVLNTVMADTSALAYSVPKELNSALPCFQIFYDLIFQENAQLFYALVLVYLAIKLPKALMFPMISVFYCLAAIINAYNQKNDNILPKV